MSPVRGIADWLSMKAYIAAGGSAKCGAAGSSGDCARPVKN